MIELEHIYFKYKKKKVLFNDLSLSLQPGYIYGLLGKNGAGKTSLLKQIAGLLYPDSGICKVFGYEAKARIPEMYQEVYLIPEEFELPPMALATFVKINAVFYPKFNPEQFSHYLSEFELQEDVKLSSLSFGQKKKFLIAFGLSTNTRILILDEPTNGLDIPSKSQFRRIIAAAMDEEKAIIISTHQVRDLENLIDSIVVLEKGKIIFNRHISEIAERLNFEPDVTDFPEDKILYSEKSQGRRGGITINDTGRETRVDFELLFNGIIKNSEIINKQLNENSYEHNS